MKNKIEWTPNGAVEVVDLWSLNYPMFKTTWQEKVVLAISLLNRSTMLCLRLGETSYAESVRCKIRDAIYPKAFLTGFLELGDLDGSKENLAVRRKLRDIWTYKLIVYRGE